MTTIFGVFIGCIFKKKQFDGDTKPWCRPTYVNRGAHYGNWLFVECYPHMVEAKSIAFFSTLALKSGIQLQSEWHPRPLCGFEFFYFCSHVSLSLSWLNAGMSPISEISRSTPSGIKSAAACKRALL